MPARRTQRDGQPRGRLDMTNQPKNRIDLYDAINGRHSNWWYPANEPSRQLHSILHACKQIIKLHKALDPINPSKDAHGLTLLSVPIITLLEHASKLRKITGRADSSFWPAEDRTLLRESGRKLDAFSQGKLRILRRKFGAHADPEFLSSSDFPHPTTDLLVPPLGNSLTVSLLLLNYEGVYEWTRTPDGKDGLEIMGQVHTAEGHRPPIAVEFGKAADGSMTIEGLHYMEDPREYARRTLRECVDTYNALAAAATPRHPALRLREYEGPKDEFKNSGGKMQ